MDRFDSRKRFRLASAALALLLIALAACSPAPPTLPPLPADGLILAFGDSLTYGTGAGPEDSYPAVLERLSGRRVMNAGVPGEVSRDGLRRLPALLDRHDPALLILCHGGNDMLRRRSMEELGANLRAMIDAARERGVPILLLGVPDPGILLSSPRLYQDIARDYELPFDGKVLPEILGKNALKSDHVHPNAQGYALLAQRIHELLAKTGAL